MCDLSYVLFSEIATILLLYLSLLKEGRHDELRARIEAMPKCQKWLSEPMHDSVPPQVSYIYIVYHFATIIYIFFYDNIK